jgi:IS66 Orf2 like protein
MPRLSPPPSHADAQHHEPISYSGDPIERGDGHDGRRPPPSMTPRLRGLPMLFLSQGAQVHAGGAPFSPGATVDDLVNREEVRAAERRAAQGEEPPPDAFIFLSEARNEAKLLLWSDCGFTVLHQRLNEGTFAFPNGVAPGDKISVEDLGQMLCGSTRLTAAGPALTAQ